MEKIRKIEKNKEIKRKIKAMGMLMKNILIIDDNVVAQEIIAEEVIEKYELTVFLASNIEEAITLLKNELIDFIVCDYEMPDGKGTEVLDYLIKNLPNIPLIIFSGNFTLQLPIKFPLVSLINDKNFDSLFHQIKKYGLFQSKNNSITDHTGRT